MINRRFVVIAFFAAAAAASPGSAQTPAVADQAVLTDFAQRVQSYVELRDRMARTVLPLETLPDPGEIRRRTDALAAAIRSARQNARQGDIFSPEIAQLIRRAVRTGCDLDYAELLALVNEDLDAPLPAPTVHARWPLGVPVPTMMPDMLAALPRLPAGLEYRFMNRALVLRDIDANLILDFVPGVIPVVTTSSASTAR